MAQRGRVDETSRVVLTVPDASLEVDLAQGARVCAWRVGDLELVGSHDTGPIGHGMFLMAPWPGRVRGNAVLHGGVEHRLPPTFGEWAIHGTVLDREATVVELRPDSVETVTGLGPDWPWRGQVRHSWSLTESSLTAVMSVESLGDTFPAELGWHPWFHRRLRRGGPLEVELPAAFMLRRGDDHLPTGEKVEAGWSGPFDDAFHVPSGTATLTWPGAIRVEVESSCRWFVVYDEPDDWVCVEPQTAPPDGLDGGFVVTPGRSHEAWASWRWRRS